MQYNPEIKPSNIEGFDTNTNGRSTPLPEQALPNTLLGLMRSGISFYNIILRSVPENKTEIDYSAAQKCISNKIRELNHAVLNEQDLAEWSDVLTAPVEKFSPGKHEVTIILLGISEHRVADFSEMMTGYEYQKKNQTQGHQGMSMH